MKKSKYLTLAAVLSLATVLTACSGSDSSTTSSSSSPESTAAESSDSDDSSDTSGSEDSASEDSASADSGSADSSTGGESSSDDGSSSSSSQTVYYNVAVDTDTNIVSYSGAGQYESGDSVTISASIIDGQSYIISSASSNDVALDTDVAGDGLSASISFTMPSSDVTISIITEAVSYYSLSVEVDDASRISYSIDNANESGSYRAGAEMSITFTAIDPTNYQIASVTSEVLGEALNVTYSDDYLTATATFTMPSSNVTVSAASETRTYKIAEINNYYSSYISSISLEEGARYEAGDTVSFTFMTSNYIASSQISSYCYQYFFTVNGVTYNPSSASGGGFSTTFTCQFTMPAENVVIDLTYAQNAYNASGISVSVTDDEYVECLSIVDGVKYSKYQALNLVFKKADGVTVSSIDYQVDSGSWVNVTPDTYTNAGSSNVIYIQILSSVFSSGSTLNVKATYSVAENHSLTLVNSEYVNIASTSSYSASPTAGDAIIIYYTAIEGYYVSSGATLEGVTDYDENSVSTTSYSKIQFTMPANDVTITFNVSGQVSLTATSSTGLASPIVFRSSLYDQEGISVATPGNTIYITANPADGYLLTGFSVNGTDYTDISYNELTSYGGPYYYLAYKIPSTATSVSVTPLTTAGAVASTSIGATYASVTFDGDESTGTYEAGSSVSFEIDPTSSYLVTSGSVKVTSNSSGSSIEISDLTYNDDSTVTGTYVIPEGGAVLSASFGSRSSMSVSLVTSEQTTGSITSVSVTGAKSAASLSLDSTSATFVEQEEVSVTIETSVQYGISLYAVTSAGDTLIEADEDSTATEYSYTFCTTSTLTSVKVVEEDKSALAVTESFGDGITVSYLVGTLQSVASASAVSAIKGSVYSGQYVFMTITSSVSSSKNAYYHLITDANGNEIETTTVTYTDYDTSTTTTYYRFAPTADFTISITEVVKPVMTVVNDENLTYNVSTSDWDDLNSGSTVTPNSTIILYVAKSTYYRAEFADGVVISGYASAASYTRIRTRGSDFTLRLTSEEYVPTEDTQQETTATISFTNNSSATVFIFDNSNASGNHLYGSGTMEIDVGGTFRIQSGTNVTFYYSVVWADNVSGADHYGSISSSGDSVSFTVLGSCTVMAADASLEA